MKTKVFGGGQTGSPQTAAWHAWRQHGIGGSDCIILAAEDGVVKAPSWVKTSKWLWEVKTGRRSGEIPSNAAMQRGTDNEGPARDRFIQKTGIIISPMFGEHETMPFIRASFDGVSFGHDVLAEIKVPSLDRHLAAKKGEIPEYYLAQMAHQALALWGHPDCFDGKDANYISFHPETDDLVVINNIQTGGFDVPLVSCLKPIAERLMVIEEAFWSSVKSDVLPCGTEWVIAARDYLSVAQQIEILKESSEAAKNRLIALLGDKSKEVGGGISMSRIKKSGNIDYKALLKEHLPNLQDEDIEKFRKAESESFTIRVQDEV